MAASDALPTMKRLFLGLSDSTRLRLLNLIAGHEVCVCYLVEVLGMPQPTISRHLAYLRRTGLVAARRQGKWMHYSILFPEPAPARRLVLDVLRALSMDKSMQKERARLQGACCPVKKFTGSGVKGRLDWAMPRESTSWKKHV